MFEIAKVIARCIPRWRLGPNVRNLLREDFQFLRLIKFISTNDSSFLDLRSLSCSVTSRRAHVRIYVCVHRSDLCSKYWTTISELKRMREGDLAALLGCQKRATARDHKRCNGATNSIFNSTGPSKKINKSQVVHLCVTCI